VALATSIARVAHFHHWPMGWWRDARWSDVRVALMMMAEQREADTVEHDDLGDSPGGGFGVPPSAEVLSLLPREVTG